VSDPYREFYRGAMQRIQPHEDSETNVALTTICWLFLAKRSLRQKELLHALAFSGRNPHIGKDIPAISLVLKKCAGLVVVDEIHDTVRLFHKSFDDFLAKNHSTWFPYGDDIIGTACVRYLSSDVFAGGPCPVVDPASLWSKCAAEDRTILYKKRLQQFPFYEYASKHWYDHVRGGELETADLITTFLADDNKLSASWQTLQCLVPRTTGVHIAIRCSLNKSLERHMKLCRPQLNVKDNFGRTPLSYAAEMNHIMAANRLIEAGVDPNTQDERPADWVGFFRMSAYNPLSYAAVLGHLQMAGVLLKMGARVDQQDCRGRSVLSYAAQRGSEAVMRLLLEHGSTVDSQDHEQMTALYYATKAGSAEAVSELLSHGADVNQADNTGVTPLLLAARAGCHHIISLLLAKGAQVNSKCRDSDTPLSQAVKAQLIDSVRLLLRAGVKVDDFALPQDSLSQACNTGPKELVLLLLSAGGNVEHMNNRVVPPLAYVARNSWTEIVQLFLDRGARADDIDRDTRSVLSYAVEGGSTECVELLLKRGAKINRKNRDLRFCESLYYALGMMLYNNGGAALEQVDERMLKFLLSRGADPNRLDTFSRCRGRRSPLFFAMEHLPTGDPHTKQVIELLLEYGARFDREDGDDAVLRCTKQHGSGVHNLLDQHGAFEAMGTDLVYSPSYLSSGS